MQSLVTGNRRLDSQAHAELHVVSAQKDAVESIDVCDFIHSLKSRNGFDLRNNGWLMIKKILSPMDVNRSAAPERALTLGREAKRPDNGLCLRFAVNLRRHDGRGRRVGE